MKTSMIRVGLSLILAVGWGITRLPAQEVLPPGTPVRVESAPNSFPRPVANAIHGTYWAGKATANKAGLCCAANVDSIGCSNLRSHLVFQLGSCRDWFGEACDPTRQSARPLPQGTPVVGAYAGWSK
jgi:hypothetical protein